MSNRGDAGSGIDWRATSLLLLDELRSRLDLEYAGHQDVTIHGVEDQLLGKRQPGAVAASLRGWFLAEADGTPRSTLLFAWEKGVIFELAELERRPEVDLDASLVPPPAPGLMMVARSRAMSEPPHPDPEAEQRLCQRAATALRAMLDRHDRTLSGPLPIPPPGKEHEPVTEESLTMRMPWRPRLRASPDGDWSAATILRAQAPSRLSGRALIDEPPLGAMVLLVPEASLNPSSHPLTDRLRELFGRVAPTWARHLPWQRSAQHEIGGRLGILDHYGGGPDDGRAVCLVAEVEPGLGIVGLAFAPATRSRALDAVLVPLLSSAHVAAGDLLWPLPTAWRRVEEIEMTTDELRAIARLEPLGWRDREQWVQEVFARAPFLRDYRQLAEREITVAGADWARLWRFDWQPQGLGRWLSNVVIGVAGADGFSITCEVPFEGIGQNILVDPDRVVAMVSLR